MKSSTSRSSSVNGSYFSNDPLSVVGFLRAATRGSAGETAVAKPTEAKTTAKAKTVTARRKNEGSLGEASREFQ